MVIAQCQKCKREPSTVVSRKETFCKSCFLKFVKGKQRKQMKDGRFKVKYGRNEDQTTEKTVSAILAFRFDGSSLVLLDILISWLEEQLAMSPRAHVGFNLTVLCYSLEQPQSWIAEKATQIKTKYHGEEGISRLHVKFEILDCNDEVKRNEGLSGIYLTDHFESLIDRSNKVKGDALKMIDTQIQDKSAQEDLKSVVERDVIVRHCLQLECSILLLPDCMSELAISVLAFTARGRGERISETLGDNYIDVDGNRLEVLYPLRDILKSEIESYLKICDLERFQAPKIDNTFKSVKNKTVNELVREYFESVEPEYPEVISTVVKAGSKLRIPFSEGDVKRCGICREIINDDPQNWLESITVNEGIPAKTEEEKRNYELYLSSIQRPEERELYTAGNKESISLCFGCVADLRNLRGKFSWPAD
ncbi:DEKNAAC100003 [Brettanomyces naardenensis]|uniref:Cytoplasmic tRNA 2-thiolation protein 2 n=1 Tax=Brettanomyces naardenensis TaxID=13370 RepID=A0A448YEZ9_BRENA|nr:DEKNAAC100003 [Brettanomyces naardenensis]